MDWNKIGVGVIGNGIDYGLNWLGSLFGNSFAAKQAQLNRDFQREERLAAQQFNLDMWNMENEYNTPRNQLDRLLDAGVNPNSVFSNLSSVAPGSVRTNPMSGGQASPVAPPSSLIGSGIANYYQNKLLASQASLVDAEARHQWKENSFQDANFLMSQRLGWSQVNESRSRVEKADKEIERLGEEIKGLSLQNAITSATTNEQIEIIKLTYSTMLVELDNAKKLGVLTDEQIKTEGLRQDEIKSDIAVNNSTIKLNEAQQGLITEQTKTQEEVTKTQEETRKQQEIETKLRKHYVTEVGFVPSEDLLKFESHCLYLDEQDPENNPGSKKWDKYMNALNDKRDAEHTYTSLTEIIFNHKPDGSRFRFGNKSNVIHVNGSHTPGWNPRYSTNPR